ncbi:MAG: acetylxylan esterase [Verrucomicrobiota bacterium]
MIIVARCLLAAAFLGWLCQPVAAEVRLAQTNGEWRVSAAGYEATVGADGCLTSFRVGGQEFFKSAAKFPRGLYPFLNGLLPVPQVTREADALVARGDKVSARYEFANNAITYTLSNQHKEKILGVLVLDPAVKVVNDAGKLRKTPTANSTQKVTWFAGSASLGMEGGSRIWRPWGDGLQVWEVAVAANESQQVRLTANPATPEQLAKAREFANRPPPPPPQDPKGPMWDLAALSKAPKTFPAAAFQTNELQALFFEGLPFEGKPTRVFAWLGMPKVKPGQKVPGMVLIHGGGGTAFAEWVRLWNERGYAAIAMDTCGCVPGGSHKEGRPHHADGGPAGWGGWGQIDWAREDQWTYHAVADAVLAHSLLRACPEVDAQRIGLTGISWGGYLTCIVAGVDSRFRFAVPVYGCGFTDEHGFAGSVKSLGPERAARWMRWWDPSAYLPKAAMPFLWVTGSNDFAYTMNALQKSYRLPTGGRNLCIRLRMPHGHGGAGEKPKEIQIFADSLLKDGAPLPRVTAQGREARTAWATCESKVPVAKAELCFTRDTGKWQDRKWELAPAQLVAGKATAPLPDQTKVYYFNFTDERECVVSTEHEELP